MTKLKGQLDSAFSTAHALGAGATHVARVAVYGTRFTPFTSAANARPQKGIGKSLHSVFEGPLVRRNGGPAVKRVKQA